MDAEEQIGEWQEATGLSDGGGDPSGVTPDHLATLIRENENEVRYLKQVNEIAMDVISSGFRTTPINERMRDAAAKIAAIPVPPRTIPEF